MATPITLASLTSATINGTGVFDTLMQAMKAHLQEEFSKNRIRGPEYSTVYLGSLDAVMKTSLDFLLTQQKASLEATLLEKQIALADLEAQKVAKELLILDAQKTKLDAETAQTNAQKLMVDQQTLNLTTERELAVLKKVNVPLEGAVLIAQECKLRAEFDLTVKSTEKTNNEILLLVQKTATEKAQISALGVDADSIVGRQKKLYDMQAAGFVRDAEQKAAKILVDSWSVRRTTDEATVVDAINQLNDASVGRVVGKLMAGVGA